MKGFLHTIITLLFCCQSALAQQTPIIEGIVRDEKNQPVEFATVTLYSLPDSNLVKGVLADENGYYRIDEIKYGEYYLVCSNMGYKKTISAVILLSKESQLIKQDLSLESDILETQTIIVEAKRSLIKQEAGITVMNVDASSLNSGLTLIEVMKRVPGVTVDKDGQVKLKGKSGVMVMIDDKPLYMDDAQVATLLKSIPADQVKEIEVLTSPSVKYDAAGNAGMINIKLKKGAYEGTNGAINTSVGHGYYPKAAAGINLSYKKKKITFSGGYQYNYKKNMQAYYIDRAYVAYGDSAYNTSSRSRQPENTHSILFNGNYEASKKSIISWSGNLMQEKYNWLATTNSYLYSPGASLSSSFLTKDDSKATNYNLNSGLGYKYIVDTTGTELSVGAEYKIFSSRSTQNFTTDYYNALGNISAPTLNYWSTIPLSLIQWSMKVDFTKKIFKKIKLETGLKYNYIETKSKLSSTYIASNNFKYTEGIPAAYLTLQRKVKKWEVTLGVRAEHTKNRGVQQSIDSTFTREYTNLFPGAVISYQLTPKTIYTLLYSKRIQRPSYDNLNPFAYYNDPYSIYAGNPYLLPQYTHHTELSMSNWNGLLLTTFNYSYTTQPQADVWIINPSNLTTTYTSTNLISQINTGLALSLNMSPAKWWTMSNYLYLYKNQLKGDVGYGGVTYNRNAWMANLTHTFKLPRKFSAELSGNYESPNYWGTVLYREVWQLSAGVQKKIWREKISLKLSITDIFWKYIYVGHGTFGETKTTDGYKWDNRVLMFTLNYSFGKRFVQGENKGNNTINNSGGRKR